MNAEFDVSALHDALDAQRRTRDLNWSQLGRALGISPSTLQGMSKRRAVEGDGVLQVLRWLGCNPENFLRGSEDARGKAAPLPAVPASAGVLRFDARAIYDALEARRVERGMTWRQVGEAASMVPSSLTRLQRGGRVGFPHIMRVFAWLGQPAARFVRVSRW
jgi:DNA-binding Xre family transcriptional regulator